VDAGVASGAPAKGIDVSHYQGNINWSSVQTADGFAYAKATEGVAYTDTSFAKNWSAMKAAGIPRGAYHFFRASQDPVKQADYFVNALQSSGGFTPGTDLAPMVDVEVLDGQPAATLVTKLGQFITEAQTKLGGNVKLVIYTGPSFWISTLHNPNFSTNPLWIAHYTSAAHPIVPSHWSAYTIWQYTDVIKTPGITSGGVDGDRFNGPLSAVKSFITSDP
jgi:lysozyme